MKPACRHILILVLILAIVSAGCTEDQPPAPPPPSGAASQPGSLVRTFGNITGQGVILQGVPRGTIDTITFTLGLVPGTRSLDMNGTTIAYADSVRTEILTPVEGYFGEPPAGYWGITDTVNELGIRNLRLDYEEQFVVRINPKAPVIGDQVFTLSIRPPEGRPLLIRLIAPPVIQEQENTLRGL